MISLLEIGVWNALLATALAGLTWLATRVWRRPHVALVLWSLVLARLVAPPVLVVPWHWQSADDALEAALAMESTVPLPPTAEPPALAEAPRAGAAQDAARPAIALDAAPPAGDSHAATELPSPIVQQRDEVSAGLSAQSPIHLEADQIASALAIVWLGGSALYFALALARMSRFSASLRSVNLASPELQAEVATLARELKLRWAPRLHLTQGRMPPLLWAMWGRPAILFPAQLLARLDDRQRSDLVAHELVHLKRRDHWLNWLKLAALGMFWWHPVAWVAARRLEQASEQCCDARVLGHWPERRLSYARTLLAAVDFLAEAPALPLGAQGFTRVPPIQRRLEMILQARGTGRSSWRAKLVLGVLAAVVLSLSVRGEVAAGGEGKSSAAAIEQRLDRLEKMVEKLTEEVRALRGAEQENAAPKVLKTVPEADAKEVDPALTEIKVTFSKDMRDGSWSWTQRGSENYPEVTGKPRYIDKRTCVLPVKLEPGKTYWIGLNSARFANFKDTEGRPAVPFPLSFTTRQ